MCLYEHGERERADDVTEPSGGWVGVPFLMGYYLLPFFGVVFVFVGDIYIRDNVIIVNNINIIITIIVDTQHDLLTWL